MKLEIKDLHVEVEDKEVIRGVNLTINEGEFHVLMGPNGSGKTTLSRTILGHTKMKVTKGDILVDGESILKMPTDRRAKLGLFLLFQSPIEIEGLGLLNFLNTAKASLQGNLPFKEFMEEIKETAKNLHIKEDIIGRSLNYGFSGGEKKKIEILQMQLLKPKIAILDEPDSGLDVDAVRVVAANVNEYQKSTNAGLLLITHYSRILNYMKPDFVHVMVDGKIVQEGGRELADKIEREGYKF
jgi:Fe-S cluster assembly ATP-binding protein